MFTVWTVLSALVVVVCVGLLVKPLLGPREPWDAPRQESELDRLLGEKARTLRSLKDIEHDRQAGLMGASVYEDTRADFLARAVKLNRRIAEITGVDMTDMSGAEATS